MKNIKLNRAMNIAALRIKKASPVLCLAVGIAGTVTGTVLACRATMKAQPVIKNFKDELDKVHAMKESADSKQYGKDLTMAYFRGIGNVGKLYLPAAITEAVSIGLIIKGHKIQNARLAGLSAAYTTMSNAYNKVQKKLHDENQQLEQKFIYGSENKKIETEVPDAKGKLKKVVKNGTVINPDDIVSPYARYFNLENPNWDENPMMSLDFIMKQQKAANRMLKDRGYLFLNEVYRLLGFGITDYGQQVGWIYAPFDENAQGDSYVSFGLYEDVMPRLMNQNFVNGDCQECLLDFNVDGYILDLI